GDVLHRRRLVAVAHEQLPRGIGDLLERLLPAALHQRPTHQRPPLPKACPCAIGGTPCREWQTCTILRSNLAGEMGEARRREVLDASADTAVEVFTRAGYEAT